MNAERELELQACLDGELSAWHARRVRRQLAADPEAQRLFSELTATKTFLAGNELDRALPEDPAFYWNRIQQAVGRLEQVEEAPNLTPAVPWRRILAPLAGVALAVVLAIVGLNRAPSANPVEDAVRVAEVENLSENTDSLSFRSTSENMFVVWVHEKQAASVPDEEMVEDEDFFF